MKFYQHLKHISDATLQQSTVFYPLTADLILQIWAKTFKQWPRSWKESLREKMGHMFSIFVFPECYEIYFIAAGNADE